MKNFQFGSRRRITLPRLFLLAGATASLLYIGDRCNASDRIEDAYEGAKDKIEDLVGNPGIPQRAGERTATTLLGTLPDSTIYRVVEERFVSMPDSAKITLLERATDTLLDSPSLFEQGVSGDNFQRLSRLYMDLQVGLTDQIHQYQGR